MAEPLAAFTNPATGILVEQWKREFPLAYAPDTFWFAYPADGNPMRGTTGDTAEEAISKMIARDGERRKAA